MKILGWDSDYIIGNKLYLKGEYEIEVPERIRMDGLPSNIHTKLKISGYLTVLSSPTKHELIFKYTCPEGKTYCSVYWADMTMFIPDKCYTKQEYRELRLDNILDSE